MTDDRRYQRKCVYAEAKYANSFYGKYIFLYQGEGGLRLTAHSLRLEDCPHAVEIPFEAIKSIRLGWFSWWSKPLGSSRLEVSYIQDGELRGIDLVPYECSWDSNRDTSALVASWHETLGQVEELAERVEPSSFEPPDPPLRGGGRRVAAFFIVIVPLTIAVAVLVGLLLLGS